MEEISNMNFDHLSFSTFMKRLSNWVLNDGIDMGVKLIIGVLVIAIGFKIINNISKKFLKFAELKAVDVTIVKSIINPDGSEVSRDEYESYVNEKLGLQQENVEEMNFKEENIEAILEGMRGVTSESGGTAYSTFRNFNIEVGGKTGSAQTGVQGKTNAWFVGFAPFDDPEIAIVVFVRNGGHGSYTAEVARDIIAQYFGMNTNQVTENTTAIPTVQIIN